MGLTYDWDLVGNETLPAALLSGAASIRSKFDIHLLTGTFQEPLNKNTASSTTTSHTATARVSDSGPKPGGRVATMLLVCEAPTLGGATAFPRHHGKALYVEARRRRTRSLV